jgi:serine/threonine protein kinase
MGESSLPPISALPGDLALRLENICARFEEACKAGQRPRIEDYLGDTPQPERSVLLQELLRLELAYRRRSHETHTPEEYQARFPEHADLVRAVFGMDATGEEPAPSGGLELRTGPQRAEEAEAPTHLGRYRITATLGKGGFGVVYKGYDDDLRRDVAIKVPHRQRVAQPDDVEAYLAEARILAHLDHPHIVPVHDVGRTDDGCCYIVSKFIEGRDLAKTLKDGRLSCTEAVELITTVAVALHYAHRRGLVHRDIKCSNILLDNAGTAFVSDFGLALRDEDFGTGSTHAGTPAYMSPEQANGEGHRVDGRSDVFSLGVVFYELLTGQRPFRGRTREDLFEQITSVEPRPPRQLVDTIPKELERICLKALSKRASERYPTALDLADDLRHWQAANENLPAPIASQPTVHVQLMVPAAHITPPSAALSTPRVAITIVPKGLRSFDANDADFFLDLLPGPRDRDGLPESIRFWKTRIEERDPDKTFSVGLIYGPSGCGKTSLVRAGLLPRLAPHVLAAYIEATAVDTEARLLKGLHKHCAGLPGDLGLTETLAALRRGRGIPTGRKILLVVDQFEQWLHAKREEPSAELVRALRQCDGERVQCLLLARDDFWLAVSRLIAELEVELVQGRNMALVDLFDPRHARRVLAAFGAAFAALPERTDELTQEQKAFLEQATLELSQDGKIIPVRLALFAEMVKGKPWTPATLKETGGMEGVGITFLEETFAAPTAPPQHRLHQRAAQAVLKALLPETGSDIKGRMRSQQELLQASGYADRPKDFATLLRILDAELRLISPTDPEGMDALRRQPDVSAAGKFYQLTHDYLVPPLREWLTRKQKETRRGRAELRLAERAASWGDKPESRQLPSWWEWADIRLFTRKRDWTVSQRKMMRRATRYHAARALSLVLLVAVLGWGIQESYSWMQAQNLVDNIVSTTETADVPSLVKKLAPYRRWANARLLRHTQDAPADSKERLHASLALVPVDDRPVEYLYQHHLLTAGPTELPAIRDALFPHRNSLIERLWTVVEQPEKGKESQRLRAAAALAAYDSDSQRWDHVREPVALDLVSVPAGHLASWKESFRPVAGNLLLPLRGIFRDRQRRETDRSLATEVLVDYAASQPEFLADLLLDADDAQFAVLFPKLAEHADLGTKLLLDRLAELDLPLQPKWNDPPLDSLWTKPDAKLARKIEAAHGLLRERFGFCQTMPLEEFRAVANELRPSGYRPIRFRPYATDQNVLVAAVWTRDRQEWRLAHGLSAAEVHKQDDEYGKQSFHAVDVAGYFANGEEHYAVLWVKLSAGIRSTQLAVALDDGLLQIKNNELHNQGYWRDTTALLAAKDGRVHHAVIWSKPFDREVPYVSQELVNRSGEYLGDLQVDVHVSRAASPRSTKEGASGDLVNAEEVLRADFDDAGAR